MVSPGQTLLRFSELENGLCECLRALSSNKYSEVQAFWSFGLFCNQYSGAVATSNSRFRRLKILGFFVVCEKGSVKLTAPATGLTGTGLWRYTIA